MDASLILDWLNGKRVEGLPIPPDTYTPGYIKWGSNLNRGRGIQRARTRKQFATNRAALISLLPTIQFDTNDALEVAKMIEHDELALAYGWQYWQKGNAASWVHESDLEKLAKAKELGAACVKERLKPN